MVYLPTFTIKNQLNVGEYTIHGWHGVLFRWICMVNVGKYTVRPMDPSWELLAFLNSGEGMNKTRMDPSL